MIIIVRSPHEIKRFLEDINNLAGNETVQRFVQQEYAESCYAFEKQSLSEISGSTRQFQGASMNVPWTMIQSSNTRQFVIENSYSVKLFIYQIRYKKKSQYEDILMEPFYPSYKASLTDIYGIITGRSLTGIENLYKSAKGYSKSTFYDIRNKFQSKWREISVGDDLSLYSFDEFIDTIHHLNARQLCILFNNDITFVNKESSEKKKKK